MEGDDADAGLGGEGPLEFLGRAEGAELDALGAPLGDHAGMVLHDLLARTAPESRAQSTLRRAHGIGEIFHTLLRVQVPDIDRAPQETPRLGITGETGSEPSGSVPVRTPGKRCA